ncbi:MULTISPECIES: hypothetical protein [Paenibacillus]|uniref:hypothetical protein n=1 Tax=Paenibacillus TaxID=44249 RepID=UPI00117CAF2A|nr:hypothetical protein [Paenibacillus odorifer]
MAQVAKKNGINPAEVGEVAQVTKKNGINPLECGEDAYVAKKRAKVPSTSTGCNGSIRDNTSTTVAAVGVLSLLVWISSTDQFPVLQRWCACDFDPMANSNGPRIPSYQLPC